MRAERGAVLVGSVACCFVLASASGSRGDEPAADAAAREVHSQVERTMNAFAAMDAEGVVAGLAPEVTSFEIDLEGRPVRLTGIADARRYAEEMFAAMKEMGGSLEVDVRSRDCRAAAELAHCVVSLDFKAKMADGSEVVQPTFVTVVLRRGDDGWRWIHWHSSLAVAGAAPAP